MKTKSWRLLVLAFTVGLSFWLIPASAVVARGHISGDNPALAQASEFLADVEGVFELRDFVNIESSGSRLGDVETGFIVEEAEVFRHDYDEAFTSLTYRFEQEESLAEIYWLFYNEELVYVSLFNDSLPENFGILTDESDAIAWGWIHYKGDLLETVQIPAGASVSEMSLFQYLVSEEGDLKLVDRRGYFASLQASHLRQLGTVLATLEEDFPAFESLIAGELLEFEADEEADDEEETDFTELTDSERADRLAEQFSRSANFTDYDLLSEIATRFKDEPESVDEAMIRSELGEPYTSNEQTNSAMLLYVAEWYGYYVEQFTFVDDELVETVTEYHTTDLYTSWTDQQVNQIDRLAEHDSISLDEVIMILGAPWQTRIRYDSDIRTYIWMRYPDDKLSHVLLDIDEDNVTLLIY